MQFAQPLFAPGEVIGLLAGGLLRSMRTDRRVAGDQRLPVVQALGGDLAGVVDAHQRGGLARARLPAAGPAAGPGVGRDPRAGANSAPQRPVQARKYLICKVTCRRCMVGQI